MGLGTAIGGLAATGIGGLLGSLGQGTSKIGSASDVVNVNPMTGSMWNTLQGLLGEYSPTQNIASLEGVTPEIQSIVGQLISPYSKSLTDTAKIIGDQTQRSVANQYSNAGSVNSGAALAAMARGYAEPSAQATTNIAGMQSQLGGGIANSLLGQMGNTYLSALQGMTQYGTPEWWQPTYAQSSNALGSIGGLLSTLGGGIPGLLSGQKMGYW